MRAKRAVTAKTRRVHSLFLKQIYKTHILNFWKVFPNSLDKLSFPLQVIFDCDCTSDFFFSQCATVGGFERRKITQHDETFAHEGFHSNFQTFFCLLRRIKMELARLYVLSHDINYR